LKIKKNIKEIVAIYKNSSVKAKKVTLLNIEKRPGKLKVTISTLSIKKAKIKARIDQPKIL
jgi:hypothetical protein